VQVTSLHVKTRGTVPLPDALLRWIINSIVPGALKAAIVQALPPELGIMLSLHADHGARVEGRFAVASLDLAALAVPGPARRWNWARTWSRTPAPRR
jgi:hypothetical protein